MGVGVVVEVDAEADCFATTTLLQTNFFPDLIHVNFLPLYDLMLPCLAQVAPALGGVAEVEGKDVASSAMPANTNESAIRFDLITRQLTLLALFTYYLSNDNDYQSDKEHGATNHICFWWNAAG